MGCTQSGPYASGIYTNLLLPTTKTVVGRAQQYTYSCTGNCSGCAPPYWVLTNWSSTAVTMDSSDFPNIYMAGSTENGYNLLNDCVTYAGQGAKCTNWGDFKNKWDALKTQTNLWPVTSVTNNNLLGMFEANLYVFTGGWTHDKILTQLKIKYTTESFEYNSDYDISSLPTSCVCKCDKNGKWNTGNIIILFLVVFFILYLVGVLKIKN